MSVKLMTENLEVIRRSNQIVDVRMLGNTKFQVTKKSGEVKTYHYNKFLEYLRSNNPEEILSKSGTNARRVLNLALHNITPLLSQYKLQIERRAEMPKGVPIIYTPSHGFKDDVACTISLIKTQAYILFGSLPQFYNTFDGIAAWLNGSIMVDRNNEQSRKTAVPKMIEAVNLGANLIVYPEGVWNKTENEITQKLFPGVYDVAKETNALIAPISYNLEGSNCHAILSDAFDITAYGRKEGMEVLREKIATNAWELEEKYSQTTRADLVNQYGNLPLMWRNYIYSHINQVDFYDTETENKAQYCSRDEILPEDAYAVFDNVLITPENSSVIAPIKQLRRTMHHEKNQTISYSAV